MKEKIGIITKYLKPYKKELALLSVAGVFSALTNGFVPYVAGKLFDAIANPTRTFVGTKLEVPSFLFFLAIWFGIKIIADVIDWASTTKSKAIDHIIYTDYLIGGFSHLLEMPMSFHKERKIGEITNKIDRAGAQLSTIISSIVINLSPQFMSIFVALVISFAIKPLLATVLVAGVAIYVLVLSRVVSSVAKLQQDIIKDQTAAYGDAFDAINNTLAIKQSTAEVYEKKKLFKNFRTKLAKSWTRLVVSWENVSFTQKIIITLSQLIIYALSIGYIFKGEMTVGQMIMFNGYAAMLFGPFVVIGQYWQTIQNGLATAESTEKLLEMPIENYTPDNAVILTDINGKVEFKDVSFSYRGKQKKVLDKISFNVNPGEVVALVGESGVGKSTLSDLISGYHFAKPGKVLIDGHDVKNLNLSFLRSKIAVVPQEVVLFNDTIKNNIVYGNFSAKEKDIVKAVEMSHASEFIDAFPKKYNQIVGERGVKLSVGQKQRIAIARAVLRNPKILILDEPTSALDAKSEHYIKESLEKLMEGRTTFIIAHRLSTVQKADKILVFKEGKIAEQGKHDELVKIPDGIYKQLYEYQKL